MMRYSLSFITFSILFLCALTLSLHFFVDPYQVIGDDLLRNGHFEHALKDWQSRQNPNQSAFVKVVDGQLQLTSDSTKVEIVQILSVPATQMVRVRGSVTTVDVIEGKKVWQKARIYLVNQIKRHTIWGPDYQLFSLAGSTPWHTYQQDIPIHPAADKLIFGIKIPQGGGLMMVDALSVYMLDKNDIFHWLFYALMVVWIITALLVSRPLLKDRSYWPILIYGYIVIIFMLVPLQIKNKITDTVIDLTHQSSVSEHKTQTQKHVVNILPFPITVSMIGHFVMFLIFTLVVLLRKGLVRQNFFILVCFAALTEVLQLFSINRHPSLYDFGVNLSGVLVAGLLFLISSRLADVRARNKASRNK